jgi:A1 cistron-splicing factor AAR2
MDGELALAMVQRCASVLCLDVPEGTDVGLDTELWVVGPRFKGIKMIPPGQAHFFYYSPGDNSGLGGGPPPGRRGRFLYLQATEVAVFRWDRDTEDFVEPDADEAQRLAEGVRRLEFDQWLGAYPLANAEKWTSISRHITPPVLQRLQPVGHSVWSEMATQRRIEEKGKAKVEEEPRDGSATDTLGHKSYYTDIPKRATPPGAAPHEVTRYSIDKSYMLTLLLETKYENDQALLLGELEYSFVCFVMGQEYEGFVQWKKLVNLMCSCEEALLTHPGLFHEFIDVIHNQLRQAPVDLFMDELMADSFLMSSLKSFFELTEDERLDADLVRRGRSFKAFMADHFRLDLSALDDDDDDAPTIVEE